MCLIYILEYLNVLFILSSIDQNCTQICCDIFIKKGHTMDGFPLYYQIVFKESEVHIQLKSPQ